MINPFPGLQQLQVQQQKQNQNNNIVHGSSKLLFTWMANVHWSLLSSVSSLFMRKVSLVSLFFFVSLSLSFSHTFSLSLSLSLFLDE